MNCARKGCTQPATHHLVARVWAAGFPKTSAPIRSVIGLMFCRGHARAEAKSKALIGDEFWDRIETMTKRAGRMPVDPDSLELTVEAGNPIASINAITQARKRAMQ